MVPPETRKRNAEEIRTAAKINSEALLNAFASVPREDFVGQGPWSVLSRPAAPGQRQPEVTDVTAPRELYRDVAVYLDSSKSPTNGNPSTLAPWLDALNLSDGKSVFHLGCGTGYYTAIIAEVVGPRGQVTAADVDPVLAAQARKSLARYPNVQVIEGDGGSVDTGLRDAIFVNAGVTHPTEQWLESMTVGGTLVLPITIEIGMPHVGKGLALRVSRLASGYEARFFPMPVMIYSCTSVRDAQIGAAFGQRFMSGTFDSVRSLRRDPHSPESSCWLHSTTFCLSTQSVR
jgi:protein-L-isoaspartate(D-aspartate) O-methyltransferase